MPLKRSMPAIHIRKDSARGQYRVKVPTALREKAKGLPVFVHFPAMGRDPEFTATSTISDVVKFSLRSADPEVAERRWAIAHAHVLKVFKALKAGPESLDFKTTVALAGQVYHQLVGLNEGEPGEADNWSAIKGISRAVAQGRLSVASALVPTARASREVELAAKLFGTDLTAGIDRNPAAPPTMEALEARFGLLCNWVLSLEGRIIDAPSRFRLLRQIAEKVGAAGRQLKKNAVGDYSPDPFALTLPTLPPRKAETPKATGITLTALFDRWEAEAKPAASTVTTWRAFVKSLKAHAGHDDAVRITPEVAVAWKDSLVASGLSGNTINRTHLSGMRALYSYGLTNKLVPSNPFIGVKVAWKRQAGTKRLPYSDAEVARLLALAAHEAQPYRRWLPLLCACSGARVGEVAQLWGSSIKKDGDIWTMDLAPAPDAGSLKNEGSERTIPVHPALIAAGFLAFVAGKGTGPLFYRRSSGKATKRHASKGVSNHLADWIRESGFTDPRKAPAHALRHWFKSACVKADVPEGVADYLQGHGKRSEADGYRHYDMPTLARFLKRVTMPQVSSKPH